MGGPRKRGPPTVSGLRRELLHELILPLLHLLRREVFLVRRDAPGVPVRIGERAGPIAPELIRHRAVRRHLPALGHGALEQGVAIVHVKPKRRRRRAPTCHASAGSARSSSRRITTSTRGASWPRRAGRRPNTRTSWGRISRTRKSSSSSWTTAGM